MYLGGIDVASFGRRPVNDGGSWSPTPERRSAIRSSIVPNNVKNSTTAINSYNPDFAPDSTFLVFSQTTCAAGDSNSDKCDSDISSNVSATTWAVKPIAERDAHPPR